jgi:hypothetical protein
LAQREPTQDDRVEAAKAESTVTAAQYDAIPIAWKLFCLF